MKVTQGSLTAGNKKAIKAIIDSGKFSGRVGNTDYFIVKIEAKKYSVVFHKMDRGLGFIGDKKRLSTYKALFEL